MRLWKKTFALGVLLNVFVVIFVGYKQMDASTPTIKPRHQGSVPLATSAIEHKPPHKNIYYVKIHRTGSGSFHNVLVNFALKHNAFVALNRDFYFNLFPRRASQKVLLPPPTHPSFTGYNMWIDHARFYPDAGASFLPKDTVYITQIRDPFSHAASAFKKLKSKRKSNILFRMAYRKFMKTPEKYEPYAIRDGAFRYTVSRNVMAVVLGYSKQIENNVSDFQPYLEFLNKQFLHVTILEELPASLVLLKRKLHWELKDLLMVRIHVHSKVNTPPQQSELENHRQWNSLDYALYDFFLARHRQEVSQEGPAFQDEVDTLVAIQHNFTQFCNWSCSAFKDANFSDVGFIRQMMKHYQTILESKFSKAFNITYADCVALRLREVTLKIMLKYQMYPEACEKDPIFARKKLFLRCNPEEHVLPGLVVRDIRKQFPRECENAES